MATLGAKVRKRSSWRTSSQNSKDWGESRLETCIGLKSPDDTESGRPFPATILRTQPDCQISSARQLNNGLAGSSHLA
jgi:hypothetical protein